jgi:hypothetical protein
MLCPCQLIAGGVQGAGHLFELFTRFVHVIGS